MMSDIVSNMLKDKLDELEQVKLNIDLKINELYIENNGVESIDITENQIRSMFSKFKEFVLNRSLPECNNFISNYVKEVIVRKTMLK